MDGDFIVAIFMVLVWLASSLAARFGKARQVQPEDEAAMEGQQGTAATFQKALRELAEQLGPAEAPVASEHTLTDSEHRRTALETHSTLTERATTASEHLRTATEVRRTASEVVLQASEHQWTENEHVRGDLRQARPAASVPAARHRARSGLARRVVADLAGQDSLARAIVLREILGPPVSMRSPDSSGL